MESSLVRAAFVGVPHQIERVFAQGRREAVESLTNCAPGVVGAEDLGTETLARTEVIFSTWGMPRLSAEQLEKMPDLRAVFYAAGSVRNFARPFLERDIAVVSAWAANAVPVAQWTLAQILLANKGFYRNTREFVASRGKVKISGRGNFGAPVAVLGAGQIGRLVIQLLADFDLPVLVFDPFLSAEDAAALGVEKVELDEAFARGHVVSNHIANLPTTVEMLRGTHFAQMPENATFINTGRGATVAEPELIEVLQERPDLTALLDVTHPEPSVPDSPLWTMPNVSLTGHIAGSIGDEVVRMADYVIEEFVRWQRNEPLRYGVTLEMLEWMA